MPVSGVYLSRFGHLAQCHVIGLPKRDAKPQIFWISGRRSLALSWRGIPLSSRMNIKTLRFITTPSWYRFQRLVRVFACSATRFRPSSRSTGLSPDGMNSCVAFLQLNCRELGAGLMSRHLGSGSRTHGHLCGRVERSPFPPRMVVSKYFRWMAVDRFGRETQWSSTSSAAFAKWTVSLYSVDVTIKLRKPLEWQILG